MSAMRQAACSALLLLLAGAPAMAVEAVAPPAIYPPDTWTGRGSAVVRVLDRLDSRFELLTIPAGQTGHYKSLSITVHDCLQKAPGLPPDQAATLDVRDAHAGTPAFSGWMFEAEPFLGVLQSPIFSVSLAGCAGADAPPAAPPLPQPPVPQLAEIDGIPQVVTPGAPTGDGAASAPAGVPSGTPLGAPPAASSGDVGPPPPDSAPTPVFPSGAPEPPAPQDGAPPQGN